MDSLPCSYYCLGECYDLLAISKLLTNSGMAYSVYGKDVIHLELEGQQHSDVFIFNYGCVVFWGADSIDEKGFLDQISGSLHEGLKESIKDRCSYSINTQDSDSVIDADLDHIRLHNNDTCIRLAFSYGLSQSVKLALFEESVDSTITENRKIPYELMRTGKISLSRKELAKKIGILFLERNFVNLNSDILDVPDFFWKKPKYEQYYEMSLRFMDIKQRSDILNDKLNVIHGLYEILSTELQHIHSTRLELVIIILIFIEVLLVIVKNLL